MTHILTADTASPETSCILGLWSVPTCLPTTKSSIPASHRGLHYNDQRLFQHPDSCLRNKYRSATEQESSPSVSPRLCMNSTLDHVHTAESPPFQMSSPPRKGWDAATSSFPLPSDVTCRDSLRRRARSLADVHPRRLGLAPPLGFLSLNFHGLPLIPWSDAERRTTHNRNTHPGGFHKIQAPRQVSLGR